MEDVQKKIIELIEDSNSQFWEKHPCEYTALTPEEAETSKALTIDCANKIIELFNV